MTGQNTTDTAIDFHHEPVASLMPERLRAAIAQAAELAGQATAKATRAAHASDWASWAAWCADAGIDPLPALPAALGAYLAEQSTTRAVSTVTRRLASISAAHRQAGQPLDLKHPHIRNVLGGLRRTRGTAAKRAPAATTDILIGMLDTCDTGLLGLRDRALLLLTFSGALRRSEAVALQVSDLDFSDPEGLKLTIRRSKGDQEGEGQVLGIIASGRSTCPVQAVRTWMAAAGVTEGFVFRNITRHGRVGFSLSGKAVREIVQRRAEMAHLGPGFSAHSLRAGLITSAAAGHCSEIDIAKHSRHRSVAVLRTYVRHATLFQNPIGRVIGL